MAESTPVSIERAQEPTATRDSPEVALGGAVALLAAMVIVLFFARVTDNDTLNAFIAVAIAIVCHLLATWVGRRVERFSRP